MENVVKGPWEPDPEFWRGRRVLVTGHTGFKGAWACLWLERLGAEIHGFSLAPEGEPNLWVATGGAALAGETTGDLLDLAAVRAAVAAACPEVVLHMAAQPLVRRGYAEPLATVATNVLGTAHLLEALREVSGLRAALVVTSDKVYANTGASSDFSEHDRLGGKDPYSASKAASELIVRGLADSFLEPGGVAVATARAGNVIGGGDWAEDRLVPDLWRAALQKQPPRLRAPDSTRPWQHVLDPLSGYLRYLEVLAGEANVPRALNFGPPAGEAMTVAELATSVANALGTAHGWVRDDASHPPEAAALALDSTLARSALGWEARLSLREAAQWTARWYAAFASGSSARALCLEQIAAYEVRR